MKLQVGKSTGIALLMAAALLAALFATGVFAPAEVGAVKGTPKPMAMLSNTATLATGVTLTVTFEANDDVNNSGSRAIKVTVPTGVTAIDPASFPVGNIKAMQGDATVGRIVYDPDGDGDITAEANIFYIVEPESDSSTPLLADDTATTLTITGLSLLGVPGAGNVMLEQSGDTVETNEIAIGPIVTAFSVELTNYEVDAEKVAATIKVTSNSAAAADPNQIVITAPEASFDLDATAVSVSEPGTAANASNEIEITTGTTANTEFTITVSGLTNPSTMGDVTFTVQHGESTETDKVTIVPQTAVKLTPDVAGDAAEIVIDGTADTAIDDTTPIVVDLKKFGVPTTIPEKAVLIYDTNGEGATPDDNGYRGQPNSISVSGTKVTLTLPATVPNTVTGPAVVTTVVKDNYKITFRTLAGITNPAKAGEATIELTDADGKEEKEVTVNSAVKLSKKSGVRGTLTTATLVGFENGTATVRLETGTGANAPKPKLGEVLIANNTGTLLINTTSTDFVTGKDANMIIVEDSSGAKQGVAGKFTISPNLVLDPVETKVSKDIKLKLSDWDAGEVITKVQIGASVLTPNTSTDATKGLPMANDDRKIKTDGTLTLTVKVPSSVNRGTQTVKVIGTNDTDLSTAGTQAPTATALLKISVLNLSVQPDLAVPGQIITIQGSDFARGDTITNVMVDGKSTLVRENDGTVTVNTAGDFIATVKIPSPTDSAIGTGTKTVSVEATGSGRVAEGEIEIPKATIELDPVESRRGTTVTLAGAGFPASTVVQIAYGPSGGTIAAGTTDTSGVINTTFTVPGSADIGKPHEVKATSVATDYAAVSAKETHRTPGATFTLSATQVERGGSLTITGMNFPAFSAVSEIQIGETGVVSSPSPTTSKDGDFTAAVTVPGLAVGNYTVKVNAGGTVITESLAIIEAVVVASPDPAVIFKPLIDAGRLVRVWWLDAQNQEWLFYDPAPEFAEFNDLTEVKVGEAYIIIVTEGDSVEFQGRTLYSGSNNVALR